jgi:Zn-dependent protease
MRARAPAACWRSPDRVAVDFATILHQASIWILPALTAITLHEAAHGYAAERLGDDTARRQGRVSLNPLRHIDPVGTVLLPALLLFFNAPFLIGYAKPVPVNFWRLNNPRRDMVFVAAAGPAMNMLLALAAAMGYHAIDVLPDGVDSWAERTLQNAIVINVMLAVFNMIPIPPLDGGRVAVGVLPNALALPLARLERQGFMIVLAVFILVPWLTGLVGARIDPFQILLLPPVQALIGLVLAVTGHA